MFLNRLVEGLKRRAHGGPQARERVMSDDFERRLLDDALPAAYFSDRITR